MREIDDAVKRLRGGFIDRQVPYLFTGWKGDLTAVLDALDEAWTSDARHVVELNKADRRAEAAEAERDALQARVNDALSWRDPAYEGKCGRDTYAHGYRAALRRIHRILSTPKQGGRL